MNYIETGDLIARVNGTKKKLYVCDNNCDDMLKEIKLPMGHSF